MIDKELPQADMDKLAEELIAAAERLMLEKGLPRHQVCLFMLGAAQHAARRDGMNTQFWKLLIGLAQLAEGIKP